MSLTSSAIDKLERMPLPDGITQYGISYLVSRTQRRLARVPQVAEDKFVSTMLELPIASHTEIANAQHYEVPSEFFAQVLGPNRKYSCCLYPRADTTLAEAELLALEETTLHADLSNGQSILELGCGWGSLSFFLAERFPNSQITSVSNSKSQRIFIERAAQSRGLKNLAVITANMNSFDPRAHFDRVVSVEMFEHMANWRDLLVRARDWLNPGGRLFLHVFTHKNRSYRFDHNDAADWIARHFFTGGIMPAHDLAHRFSDLFEVEEEWRWSGENYARTANDWLSNFDAHADRITPVLEDTYDRDVELWRRRWRLFFLATAGLFGHAGGQEWGVGHYRLAPVRRS
jgi:cyclopropane-fatty-acyl-phospholipid synthase